MDYLPNSAVDGSTRLRFSSPVMLAELSTPFAAELVKLQQEFRQLTCTPGDHVPVLVAGIGVQRPGVDCGAVTLERTSVGYSRSSIIPYASARTTVLNSVWFSGRFGLCGSRPIDGGHCGQRCGAQPTGARRFGHAHFGVDFGVLRHNDHTIRATVLVAECSTTPVVPDPDPLAVIYFADADSVFAQLEHLEKGHPSASRPQTPTTKKHAIEAATGVPAISLAGVPLLSRRRHHRLPEASASSATGTGNRRSSMRCRRSSTLFAQLQARIVAEEQVRYPFRRARRPHRTCSTAER